MSGRSSVCTSTIWRGTCAGMALTLALTGCLTMAGCSAVQASTAQSPAVDSAQVSHVAPGHLVDGLYGATEQGLVCAELVRVDAQGVVQNALVFGDFNDAGYPSVGYRYGASGLEAVESYSYDAQGQLLAVETRDATGSALALTKFDYSDGTAVALDCDPVTGAPLGGRTDRPLTDDGLPKWAHALKADGTLDQKTTYGYAADESGRRAQVTVQDGEDPLSGYVGRYLYRGDGLLDQISLTSCMNEPMGAALVGWVDPSMLGGDPAVQAPGVYALGYAAAPGETVAPETAAAPSDLLSPNPAVQPGQDGTIEVPLEGIGAVVTLPSSWEGRYEVTCGWSDNDTQYYAFTGTHEGVGGLFSVGAYQGDYTYLPSYEVVGENEHGTIVVVLPTGMNVDGNVPGAVDELLSLNHDTASFVKDNVRLTTKE